MKTGQEILDMVVLIMVGLICLGMMGGMIYFAYNNHGVIGGIIGVAISVLITWVSVYVAKRM